MALSNSERQARHRDKRDAEFEALRNASENPEQVAARKEIEQLRNELIEVRNESGSSRPGQLPKTPEEWEAALLAGKKSRANKKAAARKIACEKSVPAPDEATMQEKLEQVEKQLAARKTRIRNLVAELQHMKEWNAAKLGDHVMTFETFGLLSKCLRADVGEELKDKALRALNAWRSSSRKAGS